MVVFFGLIAFSHAYSWGKVTLIGPATKDTTLGGAAGAVLIPGKSSGFVSTAITPGAVLKEGPLPAPVLPALVVAPPPPPPVYAPIYAPAPAPYYAPAPAPAPKYEAPVFEPIAIGKGETYISGPSGSVSAGPEGKALIVGPPGSAYPAEDGYYGGDDDGKYAGDEYEGKKW